MARPIEASATQAGIVRFLPKRLNTRAAFSLAVPILLGLALALMPGSAARPAPLRFWFRSCMSCNARGLADPIQRDAWTT